jgi:hypothetical protein
MRKHLSYANAVATLALLFAMSGGALATRHYLLNSVNQINPRVLNQLRVTPAATQWAQVRSGGEVNTSSHGVRATRRQVGLYEVSFAREISGCAVEVTEAGLPGRFAGGYIPEAARGSATVAIAVPGSKGVGTLGSTYPSGNTALVVTYGITPGIAADSAFFITVTC